VHLRLLAAAVTAGLALSACSDDPEPILTPTPTETPTTTTPSPTESESAEPEDPKEFIRRWVDLNTELQNTGETKDFLAASTKNCEPCHAIADRMTTIYSTGGFVRTDGWTVMSIRALNPGATKHAEFFVRLDSAPTEYRETADGPVESFPGGESLYRFVLTLRGDQWMVSDYIQRAS
jgi:hypothetical protein